MLHGASCGGRRSAERRSQPHFSDWSVTPPSPPGLQLTAEKDEAVERSSRVGDAFLEVKGEHGAMEAKLQVRLFDIVAASWPSGRQLAIDEAGCMSLAQQVLVLVHGLSAKS